MIKKFFLKITIIILLLFSANSIFAKKIPYFIRFGVEDGLAQNTVYAILQDEQGFMWFGTKDGLSRYDGSQFKNYRNNKNDSTSIGNNFIRSLFQDSQKRIWVGTDMGAYIYYPENDSFEFFDVKTESGIAIEKEVNDIKQDNDGVYWFAVDWQGVFSYSPKNNKLLFHDLDAVVNAWSLHIDKSNKVWIGTHGAGLKYFNKDTDKFENADFSSYDNKDDIYKIFPDDYNDLLITTANNGVQKLNLSTNKMNSFLPLRNCNSLFIRGGIRDSENQMWFATGAGVCVYDASNENINFYRHSHFDPYSLSDNAVYSIYKDREGGIWIGTYFGGVNYYPFQYTPFNKYYPREDQNQSQTIIGRRIREFHQAYDNKIWIGTEDGGLSLFDTQNDTFEHFLPNGSSDGISYNNIHGLLVDKDKLWIGTYSHGIDIMDIKTKKIIKRYKKNDTKNSISDNSIFSIYKDHSGRIWIGTLYGLCYYNHDTDDFTRLDSLGNLFVNDILQTKDGMVFIATLGRGLFRYNPENEKWTVFRYDAKNNTSLSHNKVISLFEDSEMNLWVTTEGGGLCKYNSGTEDFTSFTIENGLPNNVVYKIVEDNHKNIWFTTNQGIVCMNLNDYSIKRYVRSDGLLSDQFNYKSGLKDSNGNIYFGGLNGFVSFNPVNFTSNRYTAPVYIVGFELFNNEVKPSDVNSPLSRSIEFTDRIELNHSQSTFSFSFAALSYVAPDKNQYAYKLEGFDLDWIYLNNNLRSQKAGYSNVPPGKYKFKVKASNNNGIWSNNETVVSVIINPPYYKTTLAYIIYILISFTSIIYILLSYRNRINRKNRHRQEQFENLKTKEVYDAKIAFFTNIAHEIRTPLSLIKGPLDYIMNEKITPVDRNENLQVIKRNTNRLLNLSNQLLDFRKIEQKGFKVSFSNVNLSELIKETYELFFTSAYKLNKSFILNLPEQDIYADVDKEAITKILSNIFNNAVKYSCSAIELNIESYESFLKIIISNDGIKIKEHLQHKIFEPFYQIDDKDASHIAQGTGLGLPLARSLAELHGGTLEYIESGIHINTFCLTLPINQINVINSEQLTSIDKSVSYIDEDKKKHEVISNLSKYTLLIVEDDDELRSFLSKQLTSAYNILTANNGKEAISILKKKHIDIIITDLAMPIMDGLELCTEVKSNIDFSHIPIIVLTAKTNLQSKIDGLAAGADAYVEKPFSMEHLSAQLINLLSNRDKLKNAFVNSPFVKARNIALTKADEDFLKDVTNVIHKNLAETNFSVDVLASELKMSRSSLHRKIKGISELTPNEFILLVRLKKAAEFISEGMKINEVCFIVGFNSPSYFSKAFKKQFGLAPKEFMPEKETIK